MEDEKATGSRTPPPTSKGVWLKLSADLETQWLGGAGLGGGCGAAQGGGYGGQIWERAVAPKRLLPARQPWTGVTPS